MFRSMNGSLVSVSLLLLVTCIGLQVGAEFINENENRRKLNLRHGGDQQAKVGKTSIHGGIENTEKNKDTRSLIVGGTNAQDFPRSIVFLSDRRDNLQCGGSLISPTIVLAAGHCEISLVHEAVFLRYTSEESPEEIRIKVKREIFHPDYDRTTLRHDVMLLELEKSPNEMMNGNETSTPIVPYMKLHTPDDPSLQDLLDGIGARKQKHGKARKKLRNLISNRFFGKTTPEVASPVATDLQLKALGWGYTSDGASGDPSEVLQEVVLNWVKNDECEKAEESELRSYNTRISDDMMCTWRSGRDTCNGDSGGPIVIDPSSFGMEDTTFPFVQVGIVSWGEDCADHIFPGVASRVSSAYEWIRNRVCSIDGSAAPSYFNCQADNHTYSPAPSMSPSSSNTTTKEDANADIRGEGLSLVSDDPYAPKARVAVEIFLDIYSSETSWKLVEVDTGSTLANIPYKTYKYDNSDRVEFNLTMGKSYEFSIYDSFGDGIKNHGFYRIYIVDESKYETVGTILVEGDGDFVYKREEAFTMPEPKPGATTETIMSRFETSQVHDDSNSIHQQRENKRIGQVVKEPLP